MEVTLLGIVMEVKPLQPSKASFPIVFKPEDNDNDVIYKISYIKELLMIIPEVKVYATKFTKFILVNDGIDSNKITEIKPNKKINFK